MKKMTKTVIGRWWIGEPTVRHNLLHDVSPSTNSRNQRFSNLLPDRLERRSTLPRPRTWICKRISHQPYTTLPNTLRRLKKLQQQQARVPKTMKRIRVGSDNNEHGIVDKETTAEMVPRALALEELLFERSWTLRRVFVM
jgi:hypothetical protein